MVNVFFKTFGCALNRSDSELMAGLLELADFRVVGSLDDADVVIVNSCTVKGPSEAKFFTFLKRLRDVYPHKKVVIAGCISQTDPEKLHGYSLIGTSQINNIVQVVEETINDNQIELLVKENNERLLLPKKRKDPFLEIIPICEGCLGDPCAYCKVKAARGKLRSYRKEKIIEQARQALRQGVKEIWLTAQDTGCYGKDIGSSLPELLREVCSLPGEFKVRLGMLNPNHVLQFIDQLVDCYRSEKLYNFLHVPVQSGDDEMLESMRRKYSADDFRRIIKRFRDAHPHITIATDVIIGFPGELEENFQKTLDLIREIKPDVLNISRFWPRPKTEAATMDHKIPGFIAKKRSGFLTSVFHNIARMQNERWIGWTGRVLVTERGKDDTLVARNFAYKPVILRGEHKIGDVVDVRIKGCSSFDLKA